MISGTELKTDVERQLSQNKPVPRRAKFPVTKELTGILIDLTGDTNPAYSDAKWAQTSSWGGLVAPQLTMNMWTLPGYRRAHAWGEPLDLITSRLNELGYTSVAAVGNHHKYYAPVRQGDVLSQSQTLVDVSGPKQTRLGVGYFFEVLSDFHNQDDVHIGSASMQIFKWDPSSEPREHREAKGQADPLSARAGNEGGVSLPRWNLDVSAGLIVGLATATFDFNDVHLDKDGAIAAGAPDIYLNILGASALLNRYITDNFGNEAWIEEISLSLHNQTHPGDTLTFLGLLQSDPEEEELQKVKFVAENARGTFLRAEGSIRS